MTRQHNNTRASISENEHGQTDTKCITHVRNTTTNGSQSTHHIVVNTRLNPAVSTKTYSAIPAQFEQHDHPPTYYTCPCFIIIHSAVFAGADPRLEKQTQKRHCFKNKQKLRYALTLCLRALPSSKKKQNQVAKSGANFTYSSQHHLVFNQTTD